MPRKNAASRSGKGQKVSANKSQSKVTKKPETVTQKVIRGATNATLSYLKGDVLGAGLSLADTAYHAFGGGLSSRPVQVPVATGSVIRSGGDTMPRIQQTERGLRLRGRLEVGRLAVGAIGYYLYDSTNTVYALSSGSGGFTLSVYPGGNSGTTSTPLSGYPAVFCPARLRTFATLYRYYRYEGFRLTYIPTCSSSTNGSIALAWTQTTVDRTDAASFADLDGSSPSSVITMSQCPAFMQTPAWQSSALAVNPRKHGLCENVNDWMPIGFLSSATSTGLSPMVNSSMGKSDTGCIRICMSDFATPISEFTTGYLMLDYDITLHESNPPLYLNTIFQLTDSLFERENEDLLLEVRRRIRERKQKLADEIELKKLDPEEAELVALSPGVLKRSDTPATRNTSSLSVFRKESVIK